MKAKPKFPFIILFVLLSILGTNLACGLPFLAAPTPTLTPTFTPTSTSTPLPTSTNTPTPLPTATATPNLAATQAAKQEQTARDVLTQLKLPADTGYLDWYQGKKIAISLEGPDGLYQTFANNVTAGDFVISSDITWDTNSWPICGLWFRSDDRWEKGDFYQMVFLRLSGLPAWDIEYYHNGNLVSVVTQEIRYSSFLSSDDGATNQIILAAVGNEFKVYVNGNFEGRYYDYGKKLSSGKFAFVASQDSGTTTCSFNNTWIWLYK